MGYHIITGGGSGIGKALALKLDSLDKKLILIGRNENKLYQTASLCHNKPIILPCDVSDKSQRDDLVKALKKYSIQSLVHNAALVEPFSRLSELNETKWQMILKTNVEAPLFLTSALISELKEARVMFLSSGARYLNIPLMMPYCISKAMLHKIYEGFKIENPNLQFASVRPGVVETSMMAEILNAKNLEEDDKKFYQGLQKNEILLSPSIIAKFLSWLLLEADEKSYSQEEWDVYDTWHHAYWLAGESIPFIPERMDD